MISQDTPLNPDLQEQVSGAEHIPFTQPLEHLGWHAPPTSEYPEQHSVMLTSLVTFSDFQRVSMVFFHSAHTNGGVRQT